MTSISRYRRPTDPKLNAWETHYENEVVTFDRLQQMLYDIACAKHVDTINTNSTVAVDITGDSLNLQYRITTRAPQEMS